LLFARVDRRIADLMLARGRRRWPLLRLVPRTCVRQVPEKDGGGGGGMPDMSGMM